MPSTLKKNYATSIGFAIALLLIIGLVVSRALLSIASGSLILVLISNWKQCLYKKEIAVAFSLIILPVLISGLWSNNVNAWWRSVEVKLNLLTIILGLLAANFSHKQIKQLIWFLVIVIAFASLYSVYQYVQHKEEILKNYLVAKVMPTLMDDDHIRFSWLVVLSIILLVWQLSISSTKTEKIVGGLIVFFLIVYLHFLAAKTGLLCLYASVGLYIFFLLFNKQNRKWAFVLLLGIIAIGFVAYTTISSLQNRVQYVLYDFGNYSKGVFTEGSSDGARVLSMQAGWAITKQNKIKGVGFGDIQTEVNNWHIIYHATTKDYERFLPTNQWLIYGAGSGWLGILLFSIGLFLLFRLITIRSIFSTIIIVVLLIPLITDDSFEGQHGVSIVAVVFALSFYKIQQQKNKSLPL